MVWLLHVLSVSQRGTVKGNYVQAKLLNGQWKWEFQLFLTTCLPMLWRWVFFRLMRFLIDGFRQETNKKLMERMGDGLVHGQYSLTRNCDYNLRVLQSFWTQVQSCLLVWAKGKYPIWWKIKCGSHWKESSWLDTAMGLAQKTPKITPKSQHSSLRQLWGMQMLRPSAQTGVSFTMKECKLCWTG